MCSSNATFISNALHQFKKLDAFGICFRLSHLLMRESATPTFSASAVASIRREAASLSLDLAEKVLKSQLKDKAAQEKLVTEWMADVKLS